MNSFIQDQISNFISNKIIINKKVLSESFNIRCEKITLNNNESFVAKYYIKKNTSFNSINSEANSLIYLLKRFPNLFPSIKYFSKNLLIIDFIEHNNCKNENYQKNFANILLKLHSIENDKYGFDFDTQIGGLKQSNEYDSNWINFFREKRLNMIFEKINKANPMSKHINQKIEVLMKNLANYLPKNPQISLLHGDLWSGNILFHNGNLVALIDPGIYFGHNELEIAYLTWFKYVDKKFLDFYSNEIKIDKNYYTYEPIYQLYFSLLNIYLWNREYIKDTESLLKKIV